MMSENYGPKSTRVGYGVILGMRDILRLPLHPLFL